jgi:hypothetical protein
MSERVTAERVKAFAAAARLPIDDDAAARAAKAVDPTARRLDEVALQLRELRGHRAPGTMRG